MELQLLYVSTCVYLLPRNLSWLTPGIQSKQGTCLQFWRPIQGVAYRRTQIIDKKVSHDLFYAVWHLHNYISTLHVIIFRFQILLVSISRVVGHLLTEDLFAAPSAVGACSPFVRSRTRTTVCSGGLPALRSETRYCTALRQLYRLAISLIIGAFADVHEQIIYFCLLISANFHHSLNKNAKCSHIQLSARVQISSSVFIFFSLLSTMKIQEASLECVKAF